MLQNSYKSDSLVLGSWEKNKQGLFSFNTTSKKLQKNQNN